MLNFCDDSFSIFMILAKTKKCLACHISRSQNSADSVLAAFENFCTNLSFLHDGLMRVCFKKEVA